jgi:hypothetical protein
MRRPTRDALWIAAFLICFVAVALVACCVAVKADASYLPTQTWSWAPSPTATIYRVYWGASGTSWCLANRVEFPASVCTATECQGEIPEPPYSAFIVVTAANQAGESVTEHGPVVTCP